MLMAWQRRLLNNRPYFRQVFTASGSVRLDAGKYKITLVGGGGGGAGSLLSRTRAFSWAKGGVGGVVIAVVNLSSQAVLNITVGAGGKSTGGSGTANGANGTNTIVAGVPGAVMIAGAGSGASAWFSGYSGQGTPGAQGTNTVTGVARVIANNANTITSTKGVAGSAGRTPSLQANTNSPNTSVGAGGDVGVRSTSFYALTGTAGYVIIETEN